MDNRVTKPKGIIVFGANGSGKTTLGRELARVLGAKHMDVEDYWFLPSDIPYSKVRPREEVLHLMLEDMRKYGTFVLSAVTGDLGDIIPQYYSLAVYLSAPDELRIRRVKQRSYDRHGDRVREGGDLYESETSFWDFAATRDLSKIDRWARTLTCPILRLDGTEDLRANTARIAEEWRMLE